MYTPPFGNQPPTLILSHCQSSESEPVTAIVFHDNLINGLTPRRQQSRRGPNAIGDIPI